MPTAEQLLMAEDKILRIDLDSREIIIPSSVTNIGVESDDEVLRLHFSMPRMYCDCDLSEFNFKINYTNAQGEGDVYKVDDAKCSEDVITFSWLVGRFATKYKGDVSFNVCLCVLDGDSVIDKELNATPATLPVLQGLETSKAVVEAERDALDAVARAAVEVVVDEAIGDIIDAVDHIIEIEEAIIGGAS